ncbi:SDR family oxidoreductase [Streptomyces sp. NPDC050433]|uniref:SDR family oxidoreductase n=1 Tax=Streptomyces sp. NPDC050433 TaxID=3365615 RepID=UPI00379C7722
MSTPHPTAPPVLVVGATGALGGKVVDDLLARGKNVRALVRPASDASKLERRGVEIARGDMLDPDSLTAAMDGADAVVTTAAGYTRRDKKAHDIDTTGNTNLAEAAHRTGVRRFVLTGILTSDQTPDVPHFWHKKLAEDRLEQLGVPFVSLRPGAFLDQVVSMAGNPLEKGRLIWMSKTDVPLTFVLTPDLAGYLAAAVDADAGQSERVDIGWDRPVSVREAAGLIGGRSGRTIKVRSVPPAVTRAAGAVVGPFVPAVKDMAAMFRWFDTGRYVADTRRQTELFGPAPTAEDAIARLTAELSALAGKATS